uniref:Uncharacterized protein n=1 Tax=Solanum lycopersicum TaxID=4081 RepID=A0A3Q7GLI1_SOLLC
MSNLKAIKIRYERCWICARISAMDVVGFVKEIFSEEYTHDTYYLISLLGLNMCNTRH